MLARTNSKQHFSYDEDSVTENEVDDAGDADDWSEVLSRGSVIGRSLLTIRLGKV
jgi:hypothetical protein